MPARKTKRPKPRVPRPSRSARTIRTSALGRSSKLTPETAATICDLIKAGNVQKIAAATVGVGESTFYKWCEKGHLVQRATREKSGTITVDTNAPAVEFRELIDEAIAASEAHLVTLLRSHALKDSRAAIFLLQQRFPERWKRPDKVEHTGGVNVNFNLIASDRELTPEQEAELYPKALPKVVDVSAQVGAVAPHAAPPTDDDDEDDDE